MESAPFILKTLEDRNISIDKELSGGADCVWLPKEKAKNLTIT